MAISLECQKNTWQYVVEALYILYLNFTKSILSFCIEVPVSSLYSKQVTRMMLKISG